MIEDNVAGLFLQADLHRIAAKAVRVAMEHLGKRLPCHVTAVSGQIVTVAFDLPQRAPWVLPEITIPKAEGPWINSPTQIGDVGLTIPADVYLGGISGIGGGQATWKRPGNLDALVWVPVAKQSTTVANQNAALVQGPDGAIIQTTQGTRSSVVTDQNGTTVTYGSNTLVVNGSEIAGTVGNTSLSVTGSAITMTAGGQTVTVDSNGLTINGIVFGTHTHPYLPGTGAQTETGAPQ